MRLLIVSQYFWPENFRINDLVAELVRRGHDVTVLTGLPNYPDGRVFEDFRRNPSLFDQFSGAEIIRVPLIPRGRGGLRLLINYLSFAVSASVVGVWKLRGRPFDAIFAYEPSPVTVGLPAVLLRKTKRAPLVFWVLDLWPETLSAIGVIKSNFMLRAIGGLVSFIYKRCDLILAQSKSFVPQIRNYAGPTPRIEYFPSWSESIFNMEKIEKATEIPFISGAFSIMFAGNIGESQDFPAILKTAETLKSHVNIRWLIVGDGRMSDWVAQEIRKRSLQHCVLLLGRFPVERMPSFFKHADALLVSLKDEPIFSMTIPGKLQSYLAAGIPVIAMLNGEGADVVKDAGAGVTCAAGDHAGLAQAVLRISAMSEEERSTMGRNGLAVSAREFDRDTLIDRLEVRLAQLKIGPFPIATIEGAP